MKVLILLFDVHTRPTTFYAPLDQSGCEAAELRISELSQIEICWI